MPLLTWDLYDLFAVLGVIPSYDEFETSHQYFIEQGSQERGSLTIWSCLARAEKFLPSHT